jgi:hypothetical protein
VQGGSARTQPGRTVTVLAVGFLVLDGALLTMAGVWSGRLGLILWGIVCGAGAAGVFYYWRRHLRGLREINKGLEARFRELMELKGDLPETESKEE